MPNWQLGRFISFSEVKSEVKLSSHLLAEGFPALQVWTRNVTLIQAQGFCKHPLPSYIKPTVGEADTIWINYRSKTVKLGNILTFILKSRLNQNNKSLIPQKQETNINLKIKTYQLNISQIYIKASLLRSEHINMHRFNLCKV